MVNYGRKWIAIKQENYSGFSHKPVLVQELLSWLDPQSCESYVDCTIGGGGTAFFILEKSSPGGRLLGIDQDPQAIELAKKRLDVFSSRVKLVCRNFENLRAIAEEEDLSQVDGIVLDLGISSVQLDTPERGFSFMENGPLDMRMTSGTPVTAGELVNTVPENELVSILFRFGEERYSRRIARAVVETRKCFPLQTTSELKEIVWKAVPAPYRSGRIHCATRTFQALRIAVNRELDVLEPTLLDAAQLLAPGGRLCVISFHSLEDRIVKTTFRALSKGDDPLLTILTKKPCVASINERKSNPRARSAKLRVAQRRATQ